MFFDPFSYPDAEYRTFVAQYSEKITAGPVALSLTVGQATELAARQLAFENAFLEAEDPATRTRAKVSLKRSTRNFLTEYGRMLARIIQASPTVTDIQRIDLGLPVRDTSPTPVDRPGDAPVIDKVTVVGRNVALKVRASGSESRGLPAAVDCVEVFSYVGSAPPADVREWVSEGSSTKADFDLAFPPSIPAGAQVFLCAWWKNPRQQSGPLCTPVSVYLGGGASAAA
jgi:hypothetical protein